MDKHLLRADVAAFARKMLDLELVDWQVEALQYPGNVYVSAGRGSGKSTAAVTYLLWSAMKEPGFTGLYLSGKAQLAAYAASVVRRFVAGKPLERSIVGWSDERIRLDNGSVIYLLPHAESAVRGWHNQVVPESHKLPGLVLVIDEAEIIGQRVFEAALGTLTSSDDNRLFVIGSGGSKTSWFYDLWVSGNDDDPDTKSFQVSTEDMVDTSFVSEKQLKRLKKAMLPQAYRAEVCGAFVDEASLFFKREEIERAMVNLTLPLEYNSESTYTLGVDLSSSEAERSDRTALALLEKTPEETAGRRVRRYAAPGKWVSVEKGVKIIKRSVMRVAMLQHYQYLSSVDLEDVLLDIKKSYPSLRDVYVEKYEAESLDHIVSRVRRPEVLPGDRRRYRMAKGTVDVTAHIIPPTPDNQREAFSILARIIREGELELAMHGPHAATLKQELLNFGVKLTEKRKLLSFGAQKGHDDLCYALAYSVYGMRRVRNSNIPMFG